MTITTKHAECELELKAILQLQSDNHLSHLTDEVRKQSGFVTVSHTIEILREMNAATPQIIACHEDKVVGYALAMTKEMEELVPVLKPMFHKIKDIEYNGKRLAESRYYIMGQICVHGDYRRRGILQQLYAQHRTSYAPHCDYCITEISAGNLPSIKAHRKAGFTIIDTYIDNTDEWHIVLMDLT